MSLGLRPAVAADAEVIRALVEAAYGHYVERIGRRPRPMDDDYARVIQDDSVTVAESDGAIVGVLVLAERPDGFVVENVAVDPSRKGSGVGRALLTFAEDEARSAGFGAITLYTHVLMTENQELYRRIGYVEFDRRGEDGFQRVYLRKELAT